MVSFSCETCGDILLKKKVDAHRRKCRNASFTCLDCMVNFKKNEYRAHTSCISEEQKYHGALYRSGKWQSGKQKETMAIPISNTSNSRKTSLVESIGKTTPKFNVFDFLVKDETPLLLGPENFLTEPKNSDAAQLEPSQVFREISVNKVPKKDYQTPATEKTTAVENQIELYRVKSDVGDVLNGTKRKRPHLESRSPASGDKNEELKDGPPPVLHSQLTGDLSRLMRRTSTFPSSSDFSGAREIVEASAISPTPKSLPKKTKSTKKRKEAFSISSGVKAFITAKPLPAKPPAKSSTKSANRLLKELPQTKRRSITEGPSDNDSEDLVIYQPRSEQAQLLFGLIDKGLENPRGVSMSKALQKFHRERELLGFGIGKAENERELWKDLRVRRNDRGELVLFV